MLTPASKPAAGRSDSWSDRWPESLTEESGRMAAAARLAHDRTDSWWHRIIAKAK